MNNDHTNFELPFMPKRESKPRNSGISMMMDKGLSLRETENFIEANGHYPKAGKDKKQGNLYQSLARTKRAYRNNELSEKQLELLAELNIELD